MMEAADAVRAFARGLHVIGTIGVFGAVAFHAAMLRQIAVAGAERQRIDACMQRIGRSACTLALVAGLAWLLSQAAYISGAESLAEAWEAIPAVVTQTTFGSLLLARLLLLVLAVALFPAGGLAIVPALACAAGAMLLQAGVSHPVAMPGLGGRLLLLSHGVHVLAAGVWFGSLPPLLVLMLRSTPQVAAAALRRFSAVGMGCVVLLALSAGGHGILLIGSFDRLLATDYGRMVIVKLVLFGMLLVIAVLNRFRLLPVLEGEISHASRWRLTVAIGLETVLAVLLILAAAGLMGLAPPGTSTV